MTNKLGLGLILTLLMYPCSNLTAEKDNGWKIALATGAIAGGVALLFHGISEYNARATLSDDKNSIAQLEEITHSCLLRYSHILNLIETNSPKLSIAETIRAQSESIVAYRIEFQNTYGHFKDYLAKLETNVDYWESLESRQSLLNRSKRILTTARTLNQRLNNLYTFLLHEEAYFNLFELVEKQTNYINPNDPFHYLTAAKLMDADCRAIHKELMRIKNSPCYDETYALLIKKAQLLYKGLDKQRTHLMESDDYQREVRLKVRDDREKELLIIEERKVRAAEETARAEKEKARALNERNRIEMEALWKEEKEMKKIKSRLESIENKLQSLKHKIDNPPCNPTSPDFYNWIYNELYQLD